MLVVYGLTMGTMFGLVAGVFQLNMASFMLVGGLFGVVLGILGDSGADYEKPKRHDQGRDKRKTREGVLVMQDYSPPDSVKRHRDFSRLEVPGGYVPFDMTRTETRTKDTIKTETRIKTYVDSRDMPTILSSQHTKYIAAGEQHTVKLISSGTTRYGNPFYRLELANGSLAYVFQSAYQAFDAVRNAYFYGRRSGSSAIPRVPLIVTVKSDGRWQHVKSASENNVIALPF